MQWIENKNGREADLAELSRPGGIVPVDVPTTAALIRRVNQLVVDTANAAAINAAMLEALRLIAWSNDTKWQADCARAAIARATGPAPPAQGGDNEN